MPARQQTNSKIANCTGLRWFESLSVCGWSCQELLLRPVDGITWQYLRGEVAVSYVWLDPFILGLTYTVSICLCVGSLKPDTDNLSHLPFEDIEEQTAAMTNHFSSIHSSDFFFCSFYNFMHHLPHEATVKQSNRRRACQIIFLCVSLVFHCILKTISPWSLWFSSFSPFLAFLQAGADRPVIFFVTSFLIKEIIVSSRFKSSAWICHCHEITWFRLLQNWWLKDLFHIIQYLHFLTEDLPNLPSGNVDFISWHFYHMSLMGAL